jgi:methionine biosynthesis protein MetW
MNNLNYHITIADLVPAGSRILDLGCGDGALLEHLVKTKNCSGYGVELDDANLLICAQRGVSVLQLNLEEGLSLFNNDSFDVVLQVDTFQHLHNAEIMLRETVRVGRRGIIAFPNFAHWANRLSILTGRMPVTKRLPYQWYDTPNIRVGTFSDMATLVTSMGFSVNDSFGLNEDRFIRFLPNFLASTAVFCISK